MQCFNCRGLVYGLFDPILPQLDRMKWPSARQTTAHRRVHQEIKADSKVETGH